MKKTKDFSHEKFTALCVLLNSEGNMTALEYDEFCNMLYLAKCRLTLLSEKKGCASCEFFEHGCMKADRMMPPDHVQRAGCELYENKYQIPF